MDRKRQKLTPEKKLVTAEESRGNMTSKTSNFDYLALKNEGNALYSAGDFLGAVQKYSKALILCTDNNTDRTTLLKNRAAAYLNLQEYEKVIDDTTAALEITTSDIEALFHRCQAYEQLEKYNEAFEDASAVNHLNPQNSAIQPYLRRLQEIINESNDDALHINSLPNEIILKIFGYLNQNQLGQIARVCRSWNVLTKCPILWKKANVSFFPSHRSHIIKLESFISILPSCVTSIRLYFTSYKSFIPFDFVEFCVKLQQKELQQLEELMLDSSEFTHSVPSVIDLCTQFFQNVKNLAFHECIFPDCSERREFGGTSKIEVLDLSGCFLGRLKKSLLFSRMPYLKELFLFESDADDTWFEGDASFLNQLHVLSVGFTNITVRTFSAIQKHGHNLKELYLCFIDLKDHDITFNKSVFPHLKTICLSSPYLTCKGVVSLLQSCPSLENVYVNRVVAKSSATHPFFIANSCKSGIIKYVHPEHNHNVEHSHY